MAQILSTENTYECLEYLPEEPNFLQLPPAALDLLSRTLPVLSKLVIDLGNFNGYSPSWDRAYRKTMTQPRMAPYTDGLDVICAIARFQNLRHLIMHFKLSEDQIFLMHPKPGCEAVREVFESIQGRKQGRKLVQFDVVFCADTLSVFGFFAFAWNIGPNTVSTTMTVKCRNHSSPQENIQSRCNCTCDNPAYGKVIERRKRFEKFYGSNRYVKPLCTWRLERLQQKYLFGMYPTLPWGILVGSLMFLALLPSYLIFEDGKRVQFEPSLTETRCQTSGRKLRRFRGKLIRHLVP